MSSANYITARDLFLAHHWKRYIAFESKLFDGFVRGRIAAKNESSIILNTTALSEKSFEQTVANVTAWAALCLREPKAAEAVPPAHEVLSIGDWVGVSREGAVVLFAPCAYLGTTALQDGEDLSAKARAWATYLGRVRGFFLKRAFVEVTTPTLAPSPGTEPFLDPLSVTIESNGHTLEKFLITSPEFHLKKALSAGLPRIFEIAKCFRNREGGGHHRVEFHMLEWYRSFASLEEIARDTEALIQEFSPEIRLVRKSMTELFAEFASIELRSDSTRDDLAKGADEIGVRTTPDDDFGDIFHRIFLEKIEPQMEELTQGAPLLLNGYPPSMAALARIGADGFADRFEIYWRGLELCNAFHELNDPVENRKRFDSDNQAKIRSGRSPVPIDEQLLRSFDLGVPPAGGIALGLERLFMALHAQSDIESVRPFQS